MLPRILSRAIRWTEAHQLYSLEFQERDVAIWTFLRTVDGDSFRRVAMG